LNHLEVEHHVIRKNCASALLGLESKNLHGMRLFSPMASTNANEAALVKLPGWEVLHRAAVATARGSGLPQLAGGGFSGKAH
jgi:hypothetical protein